MRIRLLLAACLLLHAAAGHATGLIAPFQDQRFIYGLTADQRLVYFKSSAKTAQVIGSITNLSGDTRLVGIDFRPATGELWAIGDAGGLYVVDPATAVASFRSQATVSGTPIALSGTAFGIDFNPTVDRLRLISNTGQNLRINVETGAATLDLDLNAGTPPVTAVGVTGAGYTNNDLDAATGTTLFDIDTVNDQVVIQLPPNNGVLTPTGKLGVDASADTGFDIWSDVENGRTVSVRAFATITTDVTRLYEVDVLSGNAKDQGRFRSGQQVIGLAIPLD
jgi:hypothetical protein